MVTLKSGNITLDKITLDDAHDYYLIASNPNITTSFMLDEVENIEEAKSAIEEVINNYSDNEFYYFAIRLDGKLIGVMKSYESDYLELGYAINEEYWNKGYATIALNLVTDYFLKIELAVCEAQAELGNFPKECINKIKELAKVSVYLCLK